jgi:hypothetical protein
LAFDHQNFATQGLFPGLVTTRSVANLGHFKLEVIIEKLPRGGGGSADTTRLRKPRAEEDKYKVTIRVMYKTRIWEYERVVSKRTAEVTAKLLRAEMPREEAAPDITVSTVVEKPVTEPTIEVYKK